jgi:hypothetical protein
MEDAQVGLDRQQGIESVDLMWPPKPRRGKLEIPSPQSFGLKNGKLVPSAFRAIVE